VGRQEGALYFVLGALFLPKIRGHGFCLKFGGTRLSGQAQAQKPAQSTKHKVQSTEYKAQSTKHKVQSTKYKAQSTKHKALSLH
jgi:hypothetical protein